MIRKWKTWLKGKRSTHPELFFSKKEMRKISETIRQAETKTSGEIRVHLIPHFKGEPEKEARSLFEKLGMTKTSERNGVLFLLAVKDGRFVILADSGIHEKMGAGFLPALASDIEFDFKNGRFEDGLVSAILKCGELMQGYFPCRVSDENELADEISFSV